MLHVENMLIKMSESRFAGLTISIFTLALILQANLWNAKNS